ncbi:amino acid/amide ABC transporter ATP-binding protein 1, HAAT family [Ignisphaera aggregans DSM 17230]|uniref:Probable branched-chain amino acid transport ATP-binding protein LivG n=1 Tax=Ignisphaera aggregans (strain DSM 17230 / JCM 13409 / AQ1.S1) TaxID=583356 RepID=E0SS88_IGNAA|nr:amino acid/amide ABC transporter ATP-binding protein 1, HAAT family [Ignisphaera aggregans DSM 17230]
MSNDDAILIAKNVTKYFGGLVALDNVSIEVKKYSLTLLIGPNGAGKTTLINVCTGVLKPEKGIIIFDGKDITGYPPHKVYSLGFTRTFQIPQPFKSLTVLENVLAAIRSRGENPLEALRRSSWIRNEYENIEKAFRILKIVGLDRYWDWEAYKLGAGQLKMLEIARSLAAGAKLLALDEPIGGTDPSYANSIFENIRRIKLDAKISFLVIEHRIDIALKYADYVYVMDRGRVIAEGTPSEVLKNPKVAEVYLG